MSYELFRNWEPGYADSVHDVMQMSYISLIAGIVVMAIYIAVYVFQCFKPNNKLRIAGMCLNLCEMKMLTFL